ncbi:MAG: SpoIIE family protein phosphatase [Thioalkalivibrionaceae bacterium]
MRWLLHKSLVARLALATLGFALAFSVVSVVWVVQSEISDRLTDLENRVDQVVALVEPSASEAAFQLNDDQARVLVAGLISFNEIRSATIVDDFSNVLAASGDLEPSQVKAPARWWFDGLDRVERELRRDGGASSPIVGRLVLTFDNQSIGEQLSSGMVDAVIGAMINAFVLTLVLAGLFGWFVVRPLLSVTHAVESTDPAAPGDWPRPVELAQRDDELGTLARQIDRLMRAFQKGLDDRDRSSQALRALNEELEARVAERTSALEEEKTETERALVAADEARKTSEQARRLVEESIQYARRIQSAMLPDKRALSEHFDEVQVIWEPLHLVGGDYFWLEQVDETHSVIAVIDCTGHGVPGAFITMVVASALDRVLHELKLRAPAEILRELDQIVRARLRQDHADSESDDGFEAAVCVYHAPSRVLTYAGVGLPLLYLHEGKVEELRPTRGGLGYRSLKSRLAEEHRLRCEAGMVFYIVTDGAHDHVGGQPPQLFGRARLREVIEETQVLPLAQQLGAVLSRLEDHRGNQPVRDDMTLLSFRPIAWAPSERKRKTYDVTGEHAPSTRGAQESRPPFSESGAAHLTINTDSTPNHHAFGNLLLQRV